MAINNSFALLDQVFLRRLDETRNKKILVKVVALNWAEDPVAEITSNVVSGSINVDGSSAVRRTCNISLVTDMRVDEVNWSLRTKFRVYVGIYNDIDPRYEPIIWFPQGTFVITSFSSTLNAQGYTINLQGKDKMCLLNGDVGGQLFAAHEFSTIYTYHKDGTISKEYIPIYEIIREAIHTYAQEPYSNIVINDLESCGVELVDYTADVGRLYIYVQYDISQVLSSDSSYQIDKYQLTMVDGRPTITVTQEGYPSFKGYGSTMVMPARANDELAEVFEAACSAQGVTYNLAPFRYNNVYYELVKRIDPDTDRDTTAGYRATELTYPGDLTIAIGGKVTEALDKIIKMLGEFEYFYDIDGRFIFQRKRIYFNSTWTNAIVNDNETYYDSVANGSNAIYDFVSGFLIESFQNKPNLNVIKNDFAVWGAIKSVNKKKLPIHLRYAIDTKPQIYYSLLEQKAYVSNEAKVRLPDGKFLELDGQYDWRELIYQMARDNLASHDRINSLTAALTTLSALREAEELYGDVTDQNSAQYKLLAERRQDAKYHYDFKLAPAADWMHYYKWDDVNNKWEWLESEEDYENCRANNIFIYGPDISKRYLQLTSDQLEEINEQLGYDYMVAQSYIPSSAEITVHNAVQDFLEYCLDALADRINEIDIRNVAFTLDPNIAIQAQIIEFFKGNDLFNTEYYWYDDTDHRYYFMGEQYTTGDNTGARLCWEHCGWACDTASSFMLGRNVEKERALLNQYKSQSYITIAQNELDAWSDTFNTGYDAYYADMLGFWPQLYRTKQTVQTIYDENGNVELDEDGETRYTDDTADDYQEWVNNGYWNPQYVTYDSIKHQLHFVEPESMFFWIDFFDSVGANPELFEYAVSVIGRRSKAVNDDKVTGIYFRDTPLVLFTSPEYAPVTGEENLAYARINLVPPVSDYFRISSQGKSAKEVLDTMVYESTYYQDSITVSSIPVYYLEPNTRITVHDDANGIDGEYLIKSFSIQLKHDGMMSITATRAADRII